MTLSIVTTLLVALAAIAFAANVVQTRLFVANPPRGIDGLIVLFQMAGSLAAGVLLLIAVGTCSASGGLAWVAPRPPMAIGLALAVTLGVALGATAILWVWAEWDWPLTVPAGVVSGLLAPAALVAVLLACAWTPADAVQYPRAMRAAGLALGAFALVGYAWSGTLAVAAIRHAVGHKANLEAQYAEQDRRAALAPIDLLREDFAAMHEAAPLHVFVARLPDARGDETRQFVIARALKAPDLDASLARTATEGTARERRGCIDFIRFAPTTRPAWRGIVENSIAETVREMSGRPEWLTDFDHLANPDPVENVAALVEAARRVAPAGELNASIESLRAAIARLAESDARAAALRLFPA